MTEPATRDRVLEILKPLGPVMARPALGGTGLHLNGALFGVLHSGLVYLKVDKGLRDEYHAAGMRVLEPRPRQKLDAFLQVPQAVVDDSATLLAHAARAAGRPVPKAGVEPTPPPPPAGGGTSPTSGEETSASAAQPPKPARTARGKAAKTSS